MEMINKYKGGMKMADINEMGATENYGGADAIVTGIGNEGTAAVSGNEFRPLESALPVKAGFWNKVKSFLFQEIDWNKEIAVELTPYQQKVEDEINEFLHQEITWKSFKSFMLKEVPITVKGKRVF